MRGIADPRLVPQNLVGQTILADLGQFDRGADVAVFAQPLPVGWGEIGRGMRRGERAAKLFGGEHPVKRLVARGSRAQRGGRALWLAAANQCARAPVMRGRGKFGVVRARGGFGERFGGPGTIAQPPGR